MADSTTDYNNLDPLGDEAAVVDEVDAAVSGARKKPRAVDMVPEEPDAMAPDEEYQLTPAGRRERIGQIVRLVKKYRVWDNLTPVRLRRLLEELGPMFVKMGQILANRSEILPQRFCDELRRLRSDVEPVPYEVVLSCLEEEYGLRLGEMFDAIDPNPLGSASLAQVHRARLVTGEDVAVKVQRPGAQQVMAQDIDIIRSVVRIVSKFVNTDQFVDLHGRSRGVVDLVSRGDQLFGRSKNLNDFYEFHKSVHGVTCPKSYLDLCTEHVVVMDYVTAFRSPILNAWWPRAMTWKRSVPQSSRTTRRRCSMTAFSMPTACGKHYSQGRHRLLYRLGHGRTHVESRSRYRQGHDFRRGRG